jgi:hypothetical protein
MKKTQKIKMYTVNQIEKILPVCRIKCKEKQNIMLKNERFSFQVAVKADRHMRGLLPDIESPIKSCIKVFVQKNVPVYPMQNQDCPTDGYTLRSKGFLYPDILADCSGGAVLYKNLYTVFWVEVYDPGGIEPGSYKIMFRLKNADGKIFGECDYTVEALDAAAPGHDLVVTNWVHYDCLADYYRLPIFSEAYYAMLDGYIKNYVRHGNNTILTPLFTPCFDTALNGERMTAQLVDVKTDGARYTFCFDRLLFFMRFMRERGIEFFEFAPLATQWGAAFCPKIVADRDGKEVKLFGWEVASTDESYLHFLKAFLPELDRFLAENDDRKKCFFHLSDEPREATIETYKTLRGYLKSYLKDYTFIDAVKSREYLQYIDIPVVEINCTDEFTKNGDKIFVYYCCSNGTENVSNRFIEMPLLRTRILGAQLYLNNISGFLHWGYNFYYSFLSKRPINPFFELDADGRFPAGDSYVVYPGADLKPLDSIRHEMLEYALYDYSVLCGIGRKIGRDKLVQILKDSGMNGFKQYPHSEKWFIELRKRLYKILIA